MRDLWYSPCKWGHCVTWLLYNQFLTQQGCCITWLLCDLVKRSYLIRLYSLIGSLVIRLFCDKVWLKISTLQFLTFPEHCICYTCTHVIVAMRFGRNTNISNFTRFNPYFCYWAVLRVFCLPKYMSTVKMV